MKSFGHVTEVLSSLDMESYLDREGLDYKVTQGSRGIQLNLKVCPFCGSDRWKVYMNAQNGLGNCFAGSCTKRTFNTFSFIKGHTGLSGNKLAGHIVSVGMDTGWRAPRKSFAVEMEKSDLQLPMSCPLPIQGKNLEYLEKRNIPACMCEYFHLRFCRRGDYRYINEKGLESSIPFDNRVIIPVFDLDGRLVTFQGRDTTGTAVRKYLFPTGVAASGDHLYNGHNVQNTDRTVLCEGVFDVIASKMAFDEEVGLRDVVPIGSFGKHISFNQYEKFRILKTRGVREVTIMWDGERQATDDAVRSGLVLAGMGMKVRISLLPSGKDPNEITFSDVRKCFYGAIPLTKTSACRIMLKMR